MPTNHLSWLNYANASEGAGFETFHRELATYNGVALEPSLPVTGWEQKLADEHAIRRAEVRYLEAVLGKIRPLLRDVPADVDDFIVWYENLSLHGPGQREPLFPWLESEASFEDMKWFLFQEVAGEAGFEDLLAMTQVKMSTDAKLEMARNYWDEMGRGQAKGMHGPLLERLSDHLELHPTPADVVPEALALGNAMVALARNRQYAFHSAGALGVIEMTAPARAAQVNRGLKRLKVPTRKRLYFAVHAVLDIKHSQEWNRHVLRPLVAEDPRRAQAIAEGAVLRLWHGMKCFARYRAHFGLDSHRQAA